MSRIPKATRNVPFIRSTAHACGACLSHGTVPLTEVTGQDEALVWGQHEMALFLILWH